MQKTEIDEIRWRMRALRDALAETRGKVISEVLPKTEKLEVDADKLTEVFKDPHLLFCHAKLLTVNNWLTDFEAIDDPDKEKGD